MLWTKESVTKLGKAAHAVHDPCAGAFATAEACIMLSKQCRFVGCIIDTVCFRASKPSIVDVFAIQFLNENSDIFRGDERVQAAEKIY